MKWHLRVETPDAFSFQSTLISHGWIELAPFAHDESFTSLSRIEQLEDGSVVELTFTAGPSEAIEITVDGVEAGLCDTDAEALVSRARHIFNLDLELEAFYELVAGRDRYAWVAAHGAGRLLRAPTVWEDLAKTLLTTNTTWSMTRNMVSRLHEMGASGGSGRYAFPTAETVASVTEAELADQVRAGYRNAYLHEVARRIASGRMDVEAWAHSDMPSEELFSEVRSLPGFGPYAAGAMLKLLGRFDYLAIDSSVRSMFAHTFTGGESASDKAIRLHYESFGSWRGLVIWMDVMHDWFLSRHEAHPEKI